MEFRISNSDCLPPKYDERLKGERDQVMARASGAIALLIVGSTATVWTQVLQQRSNYSSGNGYPTTRYSTGSHFYYGSHAGGYWGGGSDADAGVSRGGFGATGHEVGAHS